MKFFLPRSSWLAHFLSRPRNKVRPKRQANRLTLEVLEDRLNLSTLNFLVNTTSPTSGSPTASSGGIVDAIYAANADTTDTAVNITFDSSVFTTPKKVITLTSGLTINPTVTNLSITIDGTSVGGVEIDGGGSSSNFSPFTISGGTPTLVDLTISQGHSTTQGGAINITAGNVALSDCLITNNSATNGSNATYGGGIYNAGTLSLTNTTVSSNTASYEGGGVYNSGSGALSAVDSTFSNNTMTGYSSEYGGGVENDHIASFTDCVISDNTISVTGGHGAGLGCFGTILSVSNSTITGNSVNGLGAGLYVHSGTLTVSNTTISGNSATGNAGGAYIIAATSGRFIDSTVSDNTSGTNGGGIYTFLVTVTAVNTTIAGNSSTQGGGVYADSGTTLMIIDSTISGNTASSSSGGIYVNGTVTLNDTIVANNLLNTTASDIGNSNVSTSGSFNNLIDDAASSGGLSNGSNGNMVGVPAALTPLANYAGPTQTVGLTAGSPALGAGAPYILTTLSAAVSDSDATFTVNSAASLGAGLYIRIDSEVMLITGLGGSTVAVLRGQLGTTAAVHSSGAQLYVGADQRGVIRDDSTPDIGAFEGIATLITNVSPNSGPTTGGTSVTLTGTEFESGATVTVGGISATNVVVVNATTITFTAPAGAVGSADIVVSYPDGGEASLAGGFTYVSPPPPPQTGTIDVFVFFDYDASGTPDSDDIALANSTVYLDLNHNGVFDSGEPTATTNASGIATFADVAIGSYLVRQEFAYPGAVQTAGGEAGVSLSVTGGGTVSANLGNLLFSPAVPVPANTSIYGSGNADANSAFVDGLYHTLLNRAAEPGYLASWTSQLNSGYTREQVTEAIIDSPEHRGLEVDYYYETFLGRAPETAGYNLWVNDFLGGADEADVVQGILTCPEFLTKHSDPTSFVQALYQDLLGRAADPAGQASWVAQLNAGTTQAAVVSGILRSTESAARGVDGFYAAFLHRPTDPGSAPWENDWTSGGSLTQIAASILYMPEFFQNAQNSV